MCELLLAAWVVGAMEVTPGTMTVDYIDRMTLGNPDTPAEVIRIEMPTSLYLSCYE